MIEMNVNLEILINEVRNYRNNINEHVLLTGKDVLLVDKNFHENQFQHCNSMAEFHANIA